MPIAQKFEKHVMAENASDQYVTEVAVAGDGVITKVYNKPMHPAKTLFGIHE
jgi:hypothetical protein